MWKKGITDALMLVGMKIGVATTENSMEIPQTIKNRTTILSSSFTSEYTLVFSMEKVLFWIWVRNTNPFFHTEQKVKQTLWSVVSVAAWLPCVSAPEVCYQPG